MYQMNSFRAGDDAYGSQQQQVYGNRMQSLLAAPTTGVMKRPRKNPLGIFNNPTMLPNRGPIKPGPMHPPIGLPPIFSHGIR
jgi:hypothetical protein